MTLKSYPEVQTKMRKTFLLITMLATLLVGCGHSNSQEYNRENSSINSKLKSYSNDSVEVFKDVETGCEYLILNQINEGGITPRLDATGTPICGTE